MTKKCQNVGNVIADFGKRLQEQRKADQADPLVFCLSCKCCIGRQSEQPRACLHCKRDSERAEAEKSRLAIEKLKALGQIPPRYQQAEMSGSIRQRLLDCLPDGPGPHVLTLAGPPNVGKTWNACALWRHCVVQDIAVRVWLVSDLTIYLASLWRQEEALPYDRIKELEEFAGLLILDDLGKEKLTETAAQNLFAIVSHRLMYDRPTLITTNLPWTAKGVDSVESVYGKAWLWRLQPGLILITERK